MDRNGFLPQHDCKQCAKPLNADGFHPAELYAGTYTGLCYSCERSDVRLIYTAPLDGCQSWEFPPHCPSWRRDRERFLAYPGCEKCKGRGRLWVGRSDAQGGSYSQQCPDCGARYWSHPLRTWEQSRWASIRKAAESLYHRELKKRKLLKQAEAGTIPAELCREIQAPFTARMERVQNRFKTIADRRLQRAPLST